MHMTDPDNDFASQVALIGCCGAYCGTCRPLKDSVCKGCKLGYKEGKRDIRNARCAIKRCCIMVKKLDSCADCPEYEDCRMIRGLFDKNGYKYKKYRQSMEFIREFGYQEFVAAARSWKCAYGRLNPPR